MEAKRTVRELLDRMPDDSTMEDILYHLYMVQAIERGEAEAEAGREISPEEVRERLHEQYGEMALSAIDREITETLRTMATADRRRVLAYARTLAGTTPPGAPGKSLLEHIGALGAADADEMRRVIEQDCERVNPDAW